MTQTRIWNARKPRKEKNALPTEVAIVATAVVINETWECSSDKGNPQEVEAEDPSTFQLLGCTSMDP